MNDENQDRLIRLEHGQERTNDRLDRLEHGQEQTNERLSRLEHGQEQTNERLNRLEVGQDALRGDVSEMKAVLSQLMPMMIRIDQRLSDSPKASEFYELRGRVEEISRSQPTTLAYPAPRTPAPKKTKSA